MKSIICLVITMVLINVSNAKNVFPLNPSDTILMRSNIEYSDVNVGDVNNDKKMDIILSVYESGLVKGSVDIFYRKRKKFSTKPDFSIEIKEPRGVVVKDVDGDRKNDIVINESKRNLYLCCAKNDFKPQKYSDINMRACDLLDVNLNTFNKDVVSVLSSATWWRIAKDGTVKSTYIARPPSNISGFPAAADFNKDRIIDLVFPTKLKLLIYYGPFKPIDTVTPKTLLKHSVIELRNKISTVHTGDFNGDGKQDIAVYQPEVGISFYCQKANMGFNNEPSCCIAGRFHDIKSADINNDKRDDIVVIDSNLGAIRVFLQKSDGTFGNSILDADQVLVGKKYYKLNINDINDDGAEDLIVAGCGNFIDIYYGGK